MDDPSWSQDQPVSPSPPQPLVAVAPVSSPLAAVGPGNGLAVTGMILGITSIVFCWLGIFTLAQVVLAITFGSIGIRKANRGASHKGMAVAGLTCGIVGAVLYVIFGILTRGAGFLI